MSNTQNPSLQETYFKKPPIERFTVASKSDPLSKKILKFDIQNYQSQTYSSVFGVNITTNEAGSREIIEKLAETKAARNSCHIGVSGWYNLDVIAARQTSRGIIFDSNPDVSLFFDHTFKAILECATRETFIAKMKSCISKYDFCMNDVPADLLKHSFMIAPNFLTDACSPEDEIEKCANMAHSWLGSEESYTFIRHLVLHNKIVVITRDITQHEAFLAIRQLLNDNCILIDTLYLSNVHDYMYSLPNRHDFLKTFALLSDKNTWLIDSIGGRDSDLEQRIVLSADLGIPDFDCFFPKVLSSKKNEQPVTTSEHGLFAKSAVLPKPDKTEQFSMTSIIMPLTILLVSIMLYQLVNWQEHDAGPQSRP